MAATSPKIVKVAFAIGREISSESWLSRSCIDDDGRSQGLSMVLGEQRRIHLSRIERASGDLYYTTRDAMGTITNEVVDTQVSQLGILDVTDTEITLIQGEPSICYQHRAGQLRVARRSGGEWQVETVVNHADAGADCESELNTSHGHLSAGTTTSFCHETGELRQEGATRHQFVGRDIDYVVFNGGVYCPPRRNEVFFD